jgi:AraC-like DNA-binding protein
MPDRSFDPASSYRRVPPPPVLQPYVACLWTSARASGLAHSREWGLPTGCADLVIALAGGSPRRFDDERDPVGQSFGEGLLQGVRDRPMLRHTAQASVVVGVQFRPTGLTGFCADPASALAGETIGLDALWPGFAERLRDEVQAAGAWADPDLRLRCLAQALLRQLRPQARVDQRIDWALAQLQTGAAVGAVQRASGLGATAFIAHYRRAVGLTPKRHADVLRLQRVLKGARGERSWAALAADLGYADQAHLSHQFRRLTGLTPGQYRRQVTGFVSHVACR